MLRNRFQNRSPVCISNAVARPFENASRKRCVHTRETDSEACFGARSDFRTEGLGVSLNIPEPSRADPPSGGSLASLPSAGMPSAAPCGAVIKPTGRKPTGCGRGIIRISASTANVQLHSGHVTFAIPAEMATDSMVLGRVQPRRGGDRVGGVSGTAETRGFGTLPGHRPGRAGRSLAWPMRAWLGPRLGSGPGQARPRSGPGHTPSPGRARAGPGHWLR
jgi:hypothetical protein